MPETQFITTPTVETNPRIAAVFLPVRAAQTTVEMTAVSSVIVDANTERRRLVLYNDSGQAVFVMFGPTCSTKAFSFRLGSQERYDGALGDYTGVVSAVRASGSSVLHVTEILN